ncbi:MAG TPA: hypothetical protein VNM38_05690 [Solirubrobacterales bacterium]|nr:hypothetical protein [Solirubrobacterales bacterium]
MQEKGIGPVADRDAATDEAIISLLVEDRGRWSTGEVERMIGNRLAAADGLARLRRGGLVHQCGDFVFSSRTALEAADLWGPCSPAGG